MFQLFSYAPGSFLVVSAKFFNQTSKSTKNQLCILPAIHKQCQGMVHRITTRFYFKMTYNRHKYIRVEQCKKFLQKACGKAGSCSTAMMGHSLCRLYQQQVMAEILNLHEAITSFSDVFGGHFHQLSCVDLKRRAR